MKKDLERIITLPDGFSAKAKDCHITIQGNGKEVSRDFKHGKITIDISGSQIKLCAKKATRRESAAIGTIWAHISNMIQGLQEEFVYELEICNVHFPMNVKVEGDTVVVKSFLGETTSRVAKIVPGAKVEIKGNSITVTSQNKEAAGQTAANLEKATRLQGRDRRIFQDGIYITSKCGRTV